jgi:hypothetical protein
MRPIDVEILREAIELLSRGPASEGRKRALEALIARYGSTLREAA